MHIFPRFSTGTPISANIWVLAGPRFCGYFCHATARDSKIGNTASHAVYRYKSGNQLRYHIAQIPSTISAWLTESLRPSSFLRIVFVNAIVFVAHHCDMYPHVLHVYGVTNYSQPTFAGNNQCVIMDMWGLEFSVLKKG